MPSAANVKIDKPASSAENALPDNGNGATTPLRQAITVIEHKIRNLEKRKAKLESYRDLQNAGKELNSDQKTALEKINEVVMTLDFARDLCKQFLGIASTTEKDAKKQAKRDASLKSQAELARLREILLVQDALHQMGIDRVRDDFLHGRNGATQLTEVDLKLLDEMYPAVTPKHEAGNPTSFTNEVQAAAEHLSAVVDGKPKDAFGGTYSQIKEVLGKIHESGYFDQAQGSFQPELEAAEVSNETLPEDQIENQNEVILDVPLAGSSPIETLTIEASNHPAIHGSTPTRVPPIPTDQPIVPIIPHQVPAVQPQPHLIDPGNAVQPHQLPPSQDLFYQQPPLPQQQPPPPRPIAEMLGSGNFFFLQESEIDTPDQIPTQTFTNQSFVVQPPPPIPMPVQFQPPQISPGQLPPVSHQGTGNDPAVVQMTGPGISNDEINLNKPLTEELDKHSLGRVQNRGAAPHSNNQPQSFYNNNGYSNRSSNRPNQQHSRNNGMPQHGRSHTSRQ
ncbi:caprin homolog isoform X1 [Dendroctonus ponderosae]|uniref:caprin homolog isoform X1 n=1 Tax=Dendroctonus ponderosae TaxID=77166 RepID=UPI002035B17E|nr:caprin homolog isoform X1 [Dendroctonus ponderosae]KAH1026819.1 hypothetical protein HUJ05_000436 [Dendroctonus ponderosae]KAH1026820.1 hypothetical protein HUJ05_000436 [Dendroctonus ponderosae]